MRKTETNTVIVGVGGVVYDHNVILTLQGV